MIVSEAEAAFWSDAGMAAQAPARTQGLFQLATGVLAAYGDAVTLVADAAEVAPGVTLQLAPSAYARAFGAGHRSQ